MVHETSFLRYLSGTEADHKCHAGQGPDSCRFLAFGSGGYQCLATIPVFAAEIGRRASTGQLTRLGKACVDPFDSESETVLIGREHS